jgi:hypothetical protein
LSDWNNVFFAKVGGLAGGLAGEGGAAADAGAGAEFIDNPNNPKSLSVAGAFSNGTSCVVASGVTGVGDKGGIFDANLAVLRGPPESCVDSPEVFFIGDAVRDGGDIERPAKSPPPVSAIASQVFSKFADI